MANIACRQCPKCGAEITTDNVSTENHADQQTLFVRYDPACTTIVLINSETGAKLTVSPLSNEHPPKSRHIGGIIGPY